MTRRKDDITAEIVDIVLQTRAAFGLNYALQYVQIARLCPALLYKILARPTKRLRGKDVIGFPMNPEGRRLTQRLS